MKNMSRRTLVTALLATAVMAGGFALDAALADKKKYDRNKRQQDDAWKARQDGSTLSLTEVLALVGPQIKGEIIEIEFDYEDGRAVYEFKYVDLTGRVREVYVDAQSGDILSDEPD
ncbi:hypothetical protein MNBD_ALPHA09-1985 [hydrothermal vent metagenome]|uniref:PepSY domain-containing protein n=1 Tax=hydrothermal vent metagenome TaxID=652676 RepID=A0A3B0TN91_9ZZZZ